MTETVSLILPVIGDDTILRRCITAINAQTYQHVEVIVAYNSRHAYDNALERKLDRFGGNVTIIPGKPSVARWQQWRDAIRSASGKYVMMLGHNQWLESDAVEVMCRCMEQTGTDLAEMRTVKCINGVAMKNNNPVPDAIPVDTPISGENLRSLARFIGDGSYISPSVNDKIFRRDLLLEACAPDYDGYASCAVVLDTHYMRYARSMVFMSYAGLNYNWESETERYRYSALDDAKQAFRLKELCGQDFGCLATELTEALYRHTHGLIVDNGWTPEATRHFLEIELADPLWKRIGVTETADRLVERVDKRDRWLDLRRVFGRLLK